MSSDAQVALIGVLALVVPVFVLWLKRTLRLSPEAANAVSAGSPLRPKDTDQAFIALAHKVNEQGVHLEGLKVYLPQVVGWGHRGWQHAEPEVREPLPAPPDGLAL